MNRCFPVASLSVALALAACAVAPSGPRVMALPKPGQDFARFQADDANCRGFAAAQTGGGAADQAATNTAVGSAVLGTALGAAAGAAIGAAAGNPGAGAAIGGASGLLVGSAAGANRAAATAGGLQWQYDVAYTQCMVANGYTVQQPPAMAGAYGAPGYGPYPIYAGPPVVVGVGGWYGGYRRW